MEKHKKSKDLLIAKAFDIRMKHQEIRSVFIDESDFLQTCFILKGTRVYTIDIASKLTKELEFTKNHTVVYATGNSNNQYLIILFNNGRIFAYNKNKHIIYFKNLKTILTKDNLQKFQLYTNASLSKIIILKDSIASFWFKTSQRVKELNKSITEYQGESMTIDLSIERKKLLTENCTHNYNDAFIAIFDSNGISGSMIKAYYLLLEECKEIKMIKAYLVEYLFRFDIDNHFNAIDEIQTQTHYEYRKYFNTRYVYSYMISTIEENEIQPEKSKENIIMKENTGGKCIAIGVNLPDENNAIIILFMVESYKFISTRLHNLFSSRKDKINIQDIAWICKDLFIIIQFSNGLFTFLNQSLQLVSFYEGSHYITSSRGLESLFILNYFENNKLNDNEHLTVVSSKSNGNFFFIYNDSYIICFQCHQKNFENKMFSSSFCNFDDFILEIKFTQSYINLNSNEQSNMLENIHTFIYNHFNSIFKGEIEMLYGQNESLANAIKFYVNFLRIFRSLNQINEINQTLISYLICISNDFFFYLLALKELWLSLLFLRTCEKYLLKNYRLRNFSNVINDTSIITKQKSFLLLNPYYPINNPKMKCYNKVINTILHSKFRSLLVFNAMIEFRNCHSLNINVIFFILAKEAVNKLYKKKLLDDINFILKLLIRNWKFLKCENERAGKEEYVLNGLTMNYRTELLSPFMQPKINRIDIKLDFFKDFYSIEELQHFVELNETYCRGDEETLISEYGYANNVGIIQKWILFFVNFFYADMFEDMKEYINNHLKQTITNDIRKLTENISPEEIDLSKLIYFNIFFGFMILSSFLEKLMIILSQDDRPMKLVENFNKKFISFISPVDIPYLLFEFNYIENDFERKTIQNDIVINLTKIMERHFKEYNMTVQESLEYIEFIIMKGFKQIILENDTHITNISQAPKIQVYLYASLVFYMVSIVKMGLLALIEIKGDMIKKVIDSLNDKLKKEIYQIILVIFIGYVKYYSMLLCKKNITVTITGTENDNDTMINNNRSYKQVLKFINEIYLKILKEEDDIVRSIIKEFIPELPLLVKIPYIERVLYYEYKTMNKMIKETCCINRTNDVLQMSNFSICPSNFFNWLHTLNKDYNPFNSIQSSIENFIASLLIYNSLEGKTQLAFDINNNPEIKALILCDLDESLNEENNIIKLNTIIDKVIRINMSFNGDYDQPDLRLIQSMKVSFLKTTYVLHILYIKHSMLIMTKDSHLQYIRLLSYLIIFEQNDKQYGLYLDYIIDYISKLKSSSVTCNREKGILYEIAINLHFSLLIHKTFKAYNTNVSETVKALLKTVSLNLLSKYEKFLQSDYVLLTSYADKQFSFNNKKKIRMFLFLLNNDFFLGTIKSLIEEIISYSQLKLQQQQIGKQQYKIIKDKYMVYHDAFCSLTGIPTLSRIVFNASFEMTQNDELLNCIMGNETKYNQFYLNEYELIMIQDLIGMKKSKIPLNSTSNKTLKDFDENVSIREEQYYQKKIVIRKDKSLNKSIKEHNKLKEKNIKEPILIMIEKIKKVFFKKFLHALFYRFKSQLTNKELEEITFISINPKDSSYNTTVIKEKFLTTRDIEQYQQEEFSLNSIKNYDIICLPKVKLGRSENSKLLQELLKQTKATKLSDAIRIKVTELREKLTQYEEMAKCLGKKFVSDINK